MNKLLVGLCCALAGSSALADTWSQVAVGNVMAVQVNETSMKVNGNKKSSWLLTIYNQPLANGAHYTVHWGEFDCGSKKFKYSDFGFFRLNGTLVAKQSVGSKMWLSPVHSTINDETITEVCKQSRKSFHVEEPLWKFAEKTTERLRKTGIWK